MVSHQTLEHLLPVRLGIDDALAARTSVLTTTFVGIRPQVDQPVAVRSGWREVAVRRVGTTHGTQLLQVDHTQPEELLGRLEYFGVWGGKQRAVAQQRAKQRALCGRVRRASPSRRP